MQYRKRPLVIEATQWFKNGDHPRDFTTKHSHITPEAKRANDWEGEVVRRYRSPDMDGTYTCKHCGLAMYGHGFIDTVEGGYVVCPGDWIITGVEGETYPCKPSIFETTYEVVA